MPLSWLGGFTGSFKVHSFRSGHAAHTQEVPLLRTTRSNDDPPICLIFKTRIFPSTRGAFDGSISGNSLMIQLSVRFKKTGSITRPHFWVSGKKPTQAIWTEIGTTTWGDIPCTYTGPRDLLLTFLLCSLTFWNHNLKHESECSNQKNEKWGPTASKYL